MKHKGEIVDIAVRRSGYSLTKVAQRLRISRGTLYKRFTERDLSDEFILQVGKAINYDFSIDFPELEDDKRVMESLKKRKVNSEVIISTRSLIKLEKKYKKLLDAYHKLVIFLIKIGEENNLQELKEELAEFLKDEGFENEKEELNVKGS